MTEITSREKVIQTIMETMGKKGVKYEVEPAMEVSLDILTGQIAMKATRVHRTVNMDDKYDDCIDAIVYTIICAARILDEQEVTQ